MKERFESILLQLKSNLKSPSVTSELKTEYDKNLHEKLIDVVTDYYENINLFDKQKDFLQKLLFDNANSLLEKTNSTVFNIYLPNYRNYAKFLVDNYYKNENNSSISISISIEDKLNDFLLKLSNEKKNIDIKPEKFLLNSEEFNLLTKELESRNLIKGQKFISGEYLFQGLTFEGVKYLEELNNKGTEDLTNQIIKEEIIEIPSLKFENLPEKELRFPTWKELCDWAKKECKEWEHWYQYISDLPNNIISAINIQRGATVRLWSESQKLINTPSERDFKRFSRMAIKALNEVNDSNPIVSYSELGKKMIEAMDNNPDEALEKYQNEFLRLLKISSIDKSNLVEFSKKDEEIIEILKKLDAIDLNKYKENLEKLKEADLEKLKESVNKLKKIDLNALYNKFKNNRGVLNESLFKSLEKIKDLDLEDFEKSLNSVKKMDLKEQLDLTKKIEIDNIKKEPITDVPEINDEHIIEQYNLIIKDYKEKNFGNAFNNIQKEKDKINQLIIDLENRLKEVIKSKDISKLNEIEINLDKYKNIKKEYHYIVMDAIHKTTNGRLNEDEIISLIVDFLVDLNYPKKNILIEKNRDDLNTYISIKYLNKILIIIQVRMLKDKNSTEMLTNMYNSIYQDVLKKQNNKPILYIVDSADSIFSFYEYYIITNEYSKIALVPSFKQLTKSMDTESDIYPHLDNDTPDENTKDSLSISNDIDAFAKLISYKGLTPPLSVGLFGEWGSGKSFFMKELENKINELSNKKDKTFIKNILHIRFNAWHYSDTNLWASLIYKIFTEINNQINEKIGNKNDIEKNKLFKELKSVQEAIEYKENEKSEISEKLTKLKEDKGNLETKINNEIDKIKTLKFQDYYKLILEDQNVQSDLNDLKDKLLLDNTSDINNIKKDCEEIKTFWGKLKKVNKLLSKNKKEFFFMIILLLIVNFSFYYIFNYTNILEDLNLKITSLLSTIGIYSLFIKNNINKINPFIERFTKILTNIDDLKDEKYKNEYSKIYELEKESLTFEKQKNEIENKINQLENTHDKIEKEIKDINNGKFFKRFISDKVSSSDYTKHLGLISLIRDDLLELEEYLIRDETVKIERIILYIDDLDRCSDETVVNVLEAIHLILAFKLFVVIIGIDIKWINGALKARHKNMFENGITPKQYIEKIFQIPFKIKKLDSVNKITLIESLLENDIFDESKTGGTIPPARVVEVEEVVLPVRVVEVEEVGPPIKVVEVERSLESKEIQSELLKIKKEELNFINKYVELIGNTPRTIKRFINIYRILRTHEDVNDLIYDENNDYKIVVLLLCQSFSNQDDLRQHDYLDDEDLNYYNNFDFVRRETLKSLIERFSFN